MYRPVKSVDWCQCCQWGVTFPNLEGSPNFFGNHDSPQIVHSSDNASCFHISFSFSAAYKAPLCKGGWQKSLISDWGIALYRYLTIPPSRLAPCHLPLHKGGFGAYKNLTNYAVSICKQRGNIRKNWYAYRTDTNGVNNSQEKMSPQKRIIPYNAKKEASHTLSCETSFLFPLILKPLTTQEVYRSFYSNSPT